ncbi:MAG: agmatinase, partial [Beijerinckiaceae bacterium]|nr:agmatinase [Beijerinckiaceae bacterium]
MVDQDKLAQLRARYAGQSGGLMYDAEFKAVADGQFQGERRKWPFADPATFCGAPFRP